MKLDWMPQLDDPRIASRSAEILADHQQALYARLDRLFAGLMILQWIGAVLAAAFMTPWTWTGTTASVHPHVWSTLFYGAALTMGPVVLAARYPGKAITRYTIATVQALFSCLLIMVSGGRIETHFHVFVSLAFLAAYRDWKILVPATAVIALDHFVRGIWWPQSVFGIAVTSPYRWIEHAVWVGFEDVVLWITIRQGCEEMQAAAVRAAQAEVKEEALQEFSAKAEAANQAKSAFLANMSHEIRTPLNAILGFTELLVSTAAEDDQQRRDYGETIRTSGKHLLQLINDILDLSKIEAGQMQIEQTDCVPDQVIAEVVSLMRVRAHEREITLDYRWDGPIPETIVSDPYRLRQLLLNLVSNAIKFTERGGVDVVARLDTRGPAARLVVEVRDTGIGIAPEHLGEIFRPFVQADGSVTRRFGGTGLGLAICKNIAEALEGSLAVNSEPGRGSVFTATVAAGDAAAIRLYELPPVRCTGAAADDLGATSLAGRTILIADDGATNRKLLELFLVRQGAEVAVVDNGEAACDLATSRRFDIVLMDMQMPVMDGYEATRTLRARGYSGPVLALTAHAMKGDRERCLDAGCSGYLSKPIDMDELVRSIWQSIRESAHGREERVRKQVATTTASIGGA